ncbi:uncharacterized protein LOC121728111 [Aricia agestis]|uniref:uncharacterized protein LOC121728111 n=1 Tax=Aricia agestis TaxID=91739 RepID=UPI001C2079BC|nr:uncharacterized protein LOC121728111 [Aricia agestis]
MLTLIGLLFLISHVQCARILAVFPVPSVSHQIVFRPIVAELAKRGHEVVVITTDPAFPDGKTPANLTEVDVHDVAYNFWHKMLSSEVMGIRNDPNSQIQVLIRAVAKTFEVQAAQDRIRDIIQKKEGEFDLLILEACVRPALGFSHVFKVPVIQISSFGAITFNDEYVGGAYHPLHYPSPWSERLYNLTTWEKITKLFYYMKLRNFYFNDVVDEENAILRKTFGPNTPPVGELINRVEMLMLNVHPIWIDNQPMPPNVVFLGGLPGRPQKPLPKDLQDFVDSSKHGVIYVSFGSNVIPSAFQADKMHILLNTLASVPHDVLLKWDKDELPIKADNIRISKWFPQPDILRHPKIKLFITQGGLQSTDESIACGVPMIGIPLFADQWYNVEKYVHLKIGLRLDLYTLTEKDLRDAIQKVIYDKSYRENIVKLNRLMNDQPQTSLERAVWWIEYVLRNGAAHLRAPTANMSLAQLVELDVVGAAVTVGCVLLAVMGYIGYYLKSIISPHSIKVKQIAYSALKTLVSSKVQITNWDTLYTYSSIERRDKNITASGPRQNSLIDKMGKTSLLVLFCLAFNSVNCARILTVLPAPSISHQIVFWPVINELVRRGHEVVSISPDPEHGKGKAPANLTEIDLHDISYAAWREILLKEVMGSTGEVVDQIKAIYMSLSKVFDEQMKVDEVRDIILKKKGNFDLLITETVSRPALAFSHIYKVPLVQISSFGPIVFNDHYVGSLTHPIFYPLPWHSKVYELSTWERIKKIWHHYSFQFYYNNVIGEYENQMLKTHFGPDVPSVSELCDNIDLLILDVHPLWIDNQPSPPSVVYVNGIHQKPQKDLPKDIKSYLDSSRNGVIYMSFGTNVIPSAMPPEKLQNMLEVLSRMPYDVLFKWDKEKLPIEVRNIKISKWFPQGDILRHPKIKLFIMQGGLQSMDEALSAGVPMIGIPMLSDQWYNTDKFVKHKIGIHMEDLTEEVFEKAIHAAIEDKSYRENVVKLNALMQDQPQPPLERAVWWIEHVLRHGGAAHLRARTANMPLPQFLQLDLVALALGAVAAVIVVVACTVRLICKLFTNKKTKKVKKK